MTPRIHLVGVLNITPDSFSDGGRYIQPEKAVLHTKDLVSEGASVIELGADSTRPGSCCVGAEEEWKRLRPLVSPVSAIAPVSVDTHIAATAKEAIQAGATIINDISGGSDENLLKAVADGGVKIVLMHSVSPPHDFSHLASGSSDLLSLKKESRAFFKACVRKARHCGIKEDKIILDPGMGAFLSSDADVSFKFAQDFFEFGDVGFPLMFAVSRKGFLRRDGESEPADRDPLSALLATLNAFRWSALAPLYIRAHNVSLHRDLLRRLEG